MKTLLSIFVLSLLTILVSAQSVVTIDEDSVVVYQSDKNSVEVVAHTTLTNTLNNRAVDVKWWRKVDDFDGAWSGTQVCDVNLCHFFTVDNAVFQIPAGGTVLMDMHYRNDSLPGEGYSVIEIHEVGDSANTTQTIEYRAKVEDTPTSIAPASITTTEPISIYPNPTRDYINIRGGNDLDRVEIYNILGRKVMTQPIFPSANATIIDVIDFQKGIYMVRVFDKGNNVVATQSISKTK